jgi:hypothetical protein
MREHDHSPLLTHENAGNCAAGFLGYGRGEASDHYLATSRKFD